MVDPIGILIVETAAAEYEPLVTGKGDFEGMTEVKVESY